MTATGLKSRSVDRQRKSGGPPNLARLGRLTRVLAHELRNPLAGIIASAHLVREQTAPHDPRSEGLDLIIYEAAHLEYLVRGLASLSPQRALHLLPSLLTEDAELAVRHIRPLAARHGVSVSAGPVTEVPPVLVDSELLQTALCTLLLGMLEGLRPADAINVAVASRCVQAAVEITLAASHEDRACDQLAPGRCAHAASPAETQLEALIAQALIERQHGWMNSEDDGRSRIVTVCFPVPRSPETGASPEGSGQTGSEQEGGQRK